MEGIPVGASKASDYRSVALTVIRCNKELASVPRFFVERELGSGKLVQAIADYPPPELSINAVYETAGTCCRSCRHSWGSGRSSSEKRAA